MASKDPRVNILGVGVSVLTMESALQRSKRSSTAETMGTSALPERKASSRRRTIRVIATSSNSAFLTTPDGMPTVWLGKFTAIAI